jgi:single-stranded-DNA-specific exonuclease
VTPAALLATSEAGPGLRVLDGGAEIADETGAPRLLVPAYSLGEALTLERELGIGHVLAQVLARRGLADPPAARAFLAAQERHEPSEFAGLGAALELIRGVIAAGGRIVVHGDYDVDGVCATAIMIRALRSLDADVGWFLPSRVDDGYGLS